MLLASAAVTAEDCPEFPPIGPAAIFGDGFSFFHPGGAADPVSIPPTRCGCGVKLLSRGEDSFFWRDLMLKAAESSIRVQTYIFTADKTGRHVADRLIRKRRHKLEVRLIVDAYTKFKFSDRRMYANLELEGVSVMGYEPIYLLGVINKSILNVDEVNKRFHEKYWVIDDRAAFLGGTNIADEYARQGRDPENMWRDQDVLLTGPVVSDVAAAFDQNYLYFKERRMLRLPANRPSLWARLWWALSRTGPPPEEPGVSRALPVGEMTDPRAAVRFIRSRPREREDFIYQAYLFLFQSARESILIENAYFVPNGPIIEALKQARARGVDVTVITNSMATNDVEGMQPVTRYFYLPLMEAGVSIYEWQGDHPGHGSLHSKFAVIDGRVSVIGSFNLDPRSIYLNSEDVVLIDSEKAARELEAYAREVDMKNSARVSMEQAKKWRDPQDVRQRFRLMFGMALEDWY